jgi:AcrR family transcriptional regulator
MRPRQFTDEQLCAAARRCILEHGPAVPIATIAAELGVSAAALFHRVGSKAELIRRALDLDERLEWIQQVERGPDERPVRDQLIGLAQTVDAFFRRMMPTFVMLRASGMCSADLFESPDELPPVRAVRAFTRWFAALHDDGRIHAPRPGAVAVALLGALQARHALRHAVGESFPDGEPDYLETLVSVFVEGLQPPRPEGGDA